ncbi:type II toxin-antitoxin system VapC family toxin [Pararhizobium gei]|uniref:type II toxin-antitoxin system VapC family toxin n=1 Tax=Pararhizobium gei TaxID=1395951 RepID=UPI0023DB22EF|nr:type II toxin-antitoxin system VapC family toxin [Rhizobium gei]
MHHPQGRVTARIGQVGQEFIFTSIVVVSELRFGVEKRGSGKLADRLNIILSELPVEGLNAPCDEHYAKLRALLERQGELIGQNDLFIAAHALAFDTVLVTANESEFSRVPGLKIENWLR